MWVEVQIRQFECLSRTESLGGNSRQSTFIVERNQKYFSQQPMILPKYGIMETPSARGIVPFLHLLTISFCGSYSMTTILATVQVEKLRADGLGRRMDMDLADSDLTSPAKPLPMLRCQPGWIAGGRHLPCRRYGSGVYRFWTAASNSTWHSLVASSYLPRGRYR